jgi:hypothetical protein
MAVANFIWKSAPPLAKEVPGRSLAKIAGHSWGTTQECAGNCECTRASSATQEKLYENLENVTATKG